MEKRTVTKREFYMEVQERMPQTFNLDPAVSIVIDGVSYVLEYNNESAISIYKECGLNLLTDVVTEKLNPITFRSLLVNGLKIHQPNLKALPKVSVKHYNYLVGKVLDALRSFMPDTSDLELEDETETEDEKKVP